MYFYLFDTEEGRLGEVKELGRSSEPAINGRLTPVLQLNSEGQTVKR